MKQQVRRGVFETNSSSEHSITINIGEHYSSCFESDIEGDDEVYIEQDDVLDLIPINELEKAIEKRKQRFRDGLEDIPTDILEEEMKRRKKR